MAITAVRQVEGRVRSLVHSALRARLMLESAPAEPDG